MPEGFDPNSAALVGAASGSDPNAIFEAQRQLALAQALQGQAFASPQPQNYGPIRSRVSPLAIPLKMVEALMAKRAYGNYATGMGEYYKNLSGALGGSGAAPQGGGGTNPPPGETMPPQGETIPPQGGTPGPSTETGGGPMPGPQPGAAPQSAAAPPPSVSTGGHPTALNPLGLNPALASMILVRDPAKYAELQMGTPEYRNALAAAGGNSDVARHLMLQKAIKDGTIELRPGGEAYMPNPQGGPPISIKNPNLPSGMSFIRDAQGNPQPYTLPGVLDYEQRLQTATTLGKEQGEIHEVERGGRTVPQVGLAGIAGAPGEGAPPGGGGPGPGAGGPSYFPQQAPGGAPGGAGYAGPADRSWWPDMPQSKAAVMPAYGGLSAKQEIDLKLQREAAAKMSGQFGLEADTASQKLEYSAELLRNLPQSFTGPQAQGTATFWNTVAQVPWLKKFIPQGVQQDAAGTQIAVKNLVNQAIQGARAIYGPRMAQSEVMLQKNEASPSITMGIQAIYALQRQEDAKSAYFVQRANDFSRFDDANGDPLKFEGAYSRRFPLQTFAREYAERNAPLYQIPKETMTPESIKLLQAHPEMRQQAIDRFGYLPPDFRQ